MKEIYVEHPGVILKEEFLEELKLSQRYVAGATGMSVSLLNGICLGKKNITADSAIRLARFLGTSPEFWLNLQNHYDLTLLQGHGEYASIEALAA